METHEFLINKNTLEKGKIVESFENGVTVLVEIGPQSFECDYWEHKDVIPYSKDDIELMLTTLKNSLVIGAFTPEEEINVKEDITYLEKIILLF